MHQKNVVKKNMLIYYQQRRKTKDTMFLSKILIHSRIAIFYIMEKNIFIVNCLQDFSTKETFKRVIKGNI